MVNKYAARYFYNPEQMCLICGCRTTNRQSKAHSAIPLCNFCFQAIKYPENHCIYCALPLLVGNLACPECQRHRPYFNKTICAFLYQDIGTEFIQKIKNTHDLSLIYLFTHLLFDKLKDSGIKIDLLIHVPMHWKRNLIKGNNHSYLIAKSLSEVSKIPFSLGALKQIHPKKEQKSLNANKRKTSTYGLFQALQSFKGLSIGIVDDVITTGATMNELARIVKLQGADNVYALTLARTPKA